MSDQDLGITGKDAQVVIVHEGAVKRIMDAVVSHSAEPIISEITQKHLGTSDVDVDIEHEGWKGELEITAKSALIDEFLDLVLVANRTRVPTTINVPETTHYRDGTSKSYVYPDVKILGAPKTLRRGETSTIRVSWRTGKNRIAA